MTTTPSRGTASGPTSGSRNYVEIARRYARDVLAGRVVACQWVRLACERQGRDLQRVAADPSWAYVWSDWHAADICDFAEKLPHVEGTWSTATIHLEPWQIFILTTVFGWRHRDDPARRRFNTVYLEVARKAAKSVMASIVALYCLTCEGEVGPQVKCAATTGKQSRVVFDVSKAMTERTPALVKAFRLDALANAVMCYQNGGSLAPINAKSSTQDGLNPSCTVIDELHAHTDRGLFDVLKSARGARKNPMSWYPTTAGYNLLGVCYEQRTFVTKVLQRVFEADHYFGIIYTLDDGDDWQDEAVWVKANPMLGITPDLLEMQGYCQESKDSPESEGEFKTKRLNLWLSASNAWLSLAKWDLCGDADLRLEDFEGEDAWIGGDLSQLDDMTALAIVFRRHGLIYAFVKFYLPERVVDARAKAVPAYRLWSTRDGVLTKTEGNTVDYAVVEADARAWIARFNVKALVFDYYESGGVTSRLATDGYPALKQPKSAKTFTQPARELETRVKYGKFRHDTNPCLRWHASNAVITKKVDGSILPKKEHQDSPNKIDGLDAVLQAMGAMLMDAPGDGPSMYDTPDGGLGEGGMDAFRF